MKIALWHWLERRMDRRSTWHGGLKSLVGAGLIIFLKASTLLMAGSLPVSAQEPAGQVNSSVAASARAQSIPPGEYVTEEGWGVLVVTRGKTLDTRSFSISSMGANGHSCGIDGEIVGRVAKVAADGGGGVCEVVFAPRQNGSIEVVKEEKNWQACAHFCGMRAGFDGTYLVPAKGCPPSEIREKRKMFKAAYVGGDYERAHKFLAPLLVQCAKTLYWYEKYEVINDLAVTLYHLGRKPECRRELRPLLDLAQTPNEDIEAPPIEADLLSQFARSARTNLKLCGYRVKMKEPK